MPMLCVEGLRLPQPDHISWGLYLGTGKDGEASGNTSLYPSPLILRRVTAESAEERETSSRDTLSPNAVQKEAQYEWFVIPLGSGKELLHGDELGVGRDPQEWRQEILRVGPPSPAECSLGVREEFKGNWEDEFVVPLVWRVRKDHSVWESVRKVNAPPQRIASPAGRFCSLFGGCCNPELEPARLRQILPKLLICGWSAVYLTEEK
uniref:Uncharacterized protein n=1 Tax=Chromera velia CCMP2878 TaxID=1169474 RepID=A0A0G4HJ26_9ALVE|eukprot:Cvel_7021.t1-p1 / transcript=Cvel_7021.t1 / gene=Cvel_7021 / organism=Chromera_velia_CCMP2878 / gene_product=hypothetical protein / transcript_product=hypothetical protein / location=Cvel_scaffold358:5160-5777(+) / protein_length=206 / sequence_SO=supercontig / SO=protein_coding / is_pseudo=false